MAITDRRGKFRINKDVIFSDDPMVDQFFRQVRIYSAREKDDVVYYKGVSVVFDEIGPNEQEPSYDLYVEGGSLYAERNDFG